MLIEMLIYLLKVQTGLSHVTQSTMAATVAVRSEISAFHSKRIECHTRTRFVHLSLHRLMNVLTENSSKMNEVC